MAEPIIDAVGAEPNLLRAVLFRMKEIVYVPVNHPEVIWIVIPLLITLIIMNFYYSKYGRKQEFGWSTAVSNTLVLIFVSADLIRHIYETQVMPTVFASLIADPLRLGIAIFVGLEGLLLLYSDYLHALPKKLAFFLSSTITINVTAFLAVAIVYTNLEVDLITLLAGIVFIVLLYILFGIIGLFERRS
jgi:hypothetical protein